MILSLGILSNRVIESLEMLLFASFMIGFAILARWVLERLDRESESKKERVSNLNRVNEQDSGIAEKVAISKLEATSK